MKKYSKIYVAGHNGLVGSAICKALQETGYNNIITRTHKELDLTNQTAVAEFFATEKPEFVILAAAKVGGIAANNTYRADFIYENLMIQNNVIHQSYKNNVKKLLFLGSSCIYPKNAPQPMHEECLLGSELEYTNEPYAIAKIAGIKMCESYNIQYGTNFIAAMPTNLYGPGDNFDLEKSHVLPALLRKIYLGKCLDENNWPAITQDLNKLPIKGTNGNKTETEILEKLSQYGITKTQKEVTVEIWGSGKPLREFLWSEDLARACVFLMENVDCQNTYPAGTKEIRNTHINIGSGFEISIKELAEKIKNIIGFNGRLLFNTDKPDGTIRKLVDVGKLRGLGWEAYTAIDEGVEKLYGWYVS